MTISYNWLKEYLPVDPVFAEYIDDVHRLAAILTSVGLEVEGVEKFESVKGGLEGLIVAEVLSSEQHPDADQLKVTRVNTGSDILQVVCGAPNVAAGQKVILAPPGTTLYPDNGTSIKIKKAKIRGVESFGMICAEDEIGVGDSHEGIMVLKTDEAPGAPASKVIPVYVDYRIEIGLTPNRMDGQSQLGVAKDVCAWLSHHTGKTASVISPLGRPFMIDDQSLDVEIQVKDGKLVPRYSGVTISGITVEPSPSWLQNKLNVIGLKPINNVVDITNFVLHATGQPLHAFDVSRISKAKVIVGTLPEGSPFISLDGKERKLSAEDLMICDGREEPMCIGGVFGGAESGVSQETKDIFLESAVFDRASIRRSILRHDLRTEAAVRFEKGVDISKTVEVLKYAALLIKEICGGRITSEIKDVFHEPAARSVTLRFDFLKKLSGKQFDPAEVTAILESLRFIVKNASAEAITVAVPESNPDISLPADLVEEILRISGLDNIAIPKQVRMVPGTDHRQGEFALREKFSSWLTGNGFSEILTNSITNEKYFENADGAVRILNSISEELTLLRPDMLPTALEVIEYNYNRQAKNLLFFEFGKTYSGADGDYQEKDHLCVYATGQYRHKGWNVGAADVDWFFIKGIADALFQLAGVEPIVETGADVKYILNGKTMATAAQAPARLLSLFSLKQPVFYLDINWDVLAKAALRVHPTYQPVSKFPVVTRDLSMILDEDIAYAEIEKLVILLGVKKLTGMHLFDLYKSEKLGKGKKSIAVSFSFADRQKTLTDKETDKMMQQIMSALEKTFGAEIRSHA